MLSLETSVNKNNKKAQNEKLEHKKEKQTTF